MPGEVTIDNINSSPNDISNPSLRFDAMNEINLGRVTLWSTGEMNFEILDIVSMETIYNINLVVSSKSELKVSVSEFIAKMKGD
jgi:hypothetical protein